MVLFLLTLTNNTAIKVNIPSSFNFLKELQNFNLAVENLNKKTTDTIHD